MIFSRSITHHSILHTWDFSLFFLLYTKKRTPFLFLGSLKHQENKHVENRVIRFGVNTIINPILSLKNPIRIETDILFITIYLFCTLKERVHKR